MQQEISYSLSFAAGFLTFFSPCILPLIPSYFGYLAGDYSTIKMKSDAQKTHNPSILLPALFFAAGFSLIFIILGMSASWVGQRLMANQQLFARIGGILVIILGLNMLDLITLKILRKQINIKPPGWLHRYPRSFLLGMVVSLAWSPCIGPILGSILVYAGTAENMITGTIMLALFSLGLSLPLIIAALFMEKFLEKLSRFNKYLPGIKIISGVLIIIIGILIFTGHFALLSQSWTEFLPW